MVQGFGKAYPPFLNGETAVMKPLKKLFEPINADQIKKIHARARERRLPKEQLYSMVARLTGISSITALSKQEGSHLIGWLQDPSKWLKPVQPRTKAEIGGDTAGLPYLSHIVGIRLIIKELGWDKEHMKNWLEKYMKVPNIRSLNRQRAKDAFLALRKIQDRQQGAGKGEIPGRKAT